MTVEAIGKRGETLEIPSGNKPERSEDQALKEGRGTQSEGKQIGDQGSRKAKVQAEAIAGLITVKGLAGGKAPPCQRRLQAPAAPWEQDTRKGKMNPARQRSGGRQQCRPPFHLGGSPDPLQVSGKGLTPHPSHIPFHRLSPFPWR